MPRPEIEATLLRQGRHRIPGAPAADESNFDTKVWAQLNEDVAAMNAEPQSEAQAKAGREGATSIRNLEVVRCR